MNRQDILLGKAIALFLSGAVVGVTTSGIADETTGEKISSEARDAKVTTKKHIRKGKKKVRDATGNGSVSEDVKDSAKNVGDSVDAGATKMKDKID